MSAEIERPNMRISDAEREQAIAHLQACASEGRIDLDEFSQRSEAVSLARTFGDLAPILSDLPGQDTAIPAASDSLELAPRGSTLARKGRWLVPRRIVLHPKGSSLKLDFTEAAIGHREIDIELGGKGSSISLVLPHGAFADDNVELKASSLTNKVPFTGDARGIRFNVHGKISGTSVVIRHRRRFLWWTY